MILLSTAPLPDYLPPCPNFKCKRDFRWNTQPFQPSRPGEILEVTPQTIKSINYLIKLRKIAVLAMRRTQSASCRPGSQAAEWRAARSNGHATDTSAIHEMQLDESKSHS